MAEPDGEDSRDSQSKASFKYDELVARLPLALGSKDAVDKWAEEFCYINDKFLRRRLVRQLVELPKARQDQIPYAARLVASMHHKAQFQDISHLLLAQLQAEREALAGERNSAAQVDARKFGVRYLGELVKFRVADSELALEVLKDCLDHFGETGNIEVACTLIEACEP